MTPNTERLSDEQIIAIRDEHLPSQDEPFDCIAFARAIISAVSRSEPEEWVAQVVSSGEHDFPLLEWRSAGVSLDTPIGTKLYASPLPQEDAAGSGSRSEVLNQWGKPVTACPNPEACNYHGCEAHCSPAAVAAGSGSGGVKGEADDPLEDTGALGYAARLADGLWRKHYREEAPNWQLCPDLLGILTQIDNMTTGLAKKLSPTSPPNGKTEGDADGVRGTPAPERVEVGRLVFPATSDEYGEPEIDAFMGRIEAVQERLQKTGARIELAVFVEVPADGVAIPPGEKR